jgi:hypothetical protein
VSRLSGGGVFDGGRERVRGLRGGDGREQPHNVRAVRGREVFDGGLGLRGLQSRQVLEDDECDEQSGVPRLRGWDGVSGGGDRAVGVCDVRCWGVLDGGLWLR